MLQGAASLLVKIMQLAQRHIGLWWAANQEQETHVHENWINYKYYYKRIRLNAESTDCR